MKTCLGLVLSVWLTSMLAATETETPESKEFSITGEYISESELDVEMSVSVFQKFVAANGSVEFIELALGSFVDGAVVLEGEIDEPTEVMISVSRGKEESLTLNTVVVPNENTRFAMLDYESPDIEDMLVVVGDARIVEESKSKFTIRGDLSLIDDKDLSIALAYVVVSSKNPKTDSVLPSSDPVLLSDGRFSFEGIVTEPTLVSIRVRSSDFQYMGNASAVVEPGSQIRISPSKSSSSFNPSFSSELMAHSDTPGSFHHKVIESWQSSEEYLEKMGEYADAIQKSAQNSKSNSEDSEQFDDDAYPIYQSMSLIKSSVLTPIAENLDEPMTALLAMEYGATHGYPVSRAMENWDKLASVLDEDIVARRIVPQRETLERQAKVIENSMTVVAGHKAPEFTLANLNGKDVVLYDVLAKHDVVSVDFWASWCGPCVEKLPKLKELHTEYKDQGFEIVFVSIDDTYDDWKEGSEKHEVPGVNVGDLHGFLAQTPVDYGVQWIPTEFFIDPDGEILDRGLSMAKLESYLDERLGSGTKQEKASSVPRIEQ